MDETIKIMEKTQKSSVHKHEFHDEKIRVLKGFLNLKIENRKPIPLNEKGLKEIIIPADTWHQLIAETDCQIECILTGVKKRKEYL